MKNISDNNMCSDEKLITTSNGKMIMKLIQNNNGELVCYGLGGE